MLSMEVHRFSPPLSPFLVLSVFGTCKTYQVTSLFLHTPTNLDSDVWVTLTPTHVDT